MTDHHLPRPYVRAMLVFLCLAVIGATMAATGLGADRAQASVDGKYFFTGTPDDQAQKASCTGGGPCTPPTFSKDQPDEPVPIQQSASGSCNTLVPGNPLCNYWIGAYTGTIDGKLEICWWWSTENPGALALGATIDIVVFADPDLAAGGAQENKIIASAAEVPITISPEPTMNVTTLLVDSKTVAKELMIQVDGTNSDTHSNFITHYGFADTLSAFGPPGKACPGAGPTGSPTSTPTGGPSPTPSQSPTASPTPSPTPTGGKPTSPGARISFSDPTPKKGEVTVATASLKKCPGHAGTKIQLQRQQGGKYKKVAEKKLNKTCKAKFNVRANFDKATFRSYWPKQDQDHKAGKSRPKTVTTH